MGVFLWRVRTDYRDGEAREEGKESPRGAGAEESVNDTMTLKDESADAPRGISAGQPEDLENMSGTPSIASDEGQRLDNRPAL